MYFHFRTVKKGCNWQLGAGGGCNWQLKAGGSWMQLAAEGRRQLDATGRLDATGSWMQEAGGMQAECNLTQPLQSAFILFWRS